MLKPKMVVLIGLNKLQIGKRPDVAIGPKELDLLAPALPVTTPDEFEYQFQQQR